MERNQGACLSCMHLAEEVGTGLGKGERREKQGYLLGRDMQSKQNLNKQCISYIHLKVIVRQLTERFSEMQPLQKVLTDS